MKKQRVIWLIGMLLLMTACEKDPDANPIIVPTGNIAITVHYRIDGMPLQYDTMRYQNQAGNKYSVTRLFYYLSGFRYFGSSVNAASDSVYYMDAAQGSVTITMQGIKTGTYSGFDFLIGLDSSVNKTGALPDTYENINMAWPDVMGGGYHFMKFEGHYLDGGGLEKGFTVHLGNNPYLVRHQLMNKDFSISEGQTTQLDITMNLNEWFTQPYNYNFLTDGNYTMGNGPLMQLISNNGKDVFTVQ